VQLPALHEEGEGVFAYCVSQANYDRLIDVLVNFPRKLSPFLDVELLEMIEVF
jgi:hypothetical protein